MLNTVPEEQFFKNTIITAFTKKFSMIKNIKYSHIIYLPVSDILQPSEDLKPRRVEDVQFVISQKVLFDTRRNYLFLRMPPYFISLDTLQKK
jgi:hypothetical protein